MAWFALALRVAGVLLVAHALMLLGADEISTIENGGVRTIRSLGAIFTLYGADPKSWLSSLPILSAVFALPGWAVLFVTGGLLVFLTRQRGVDGGRRMD